MPSGGRGRAATPRKPSQSKSESRANGAGRADRAWSSERALPFRNGATESRLEPPTRAAERRETRRRRAHAACPARLAESESRGDHIEYVA